MFTNRSDAGARLAHELMHLQGDDVVVVGLPRGGVPVAYQVARALDAPLDVILVRKLGLPFQPELAMGAIGEDGVRVTNHDVLELVPVSEQEFDEVERRERIELERRATRYRAGRARIPLAGRVVVIVDDGLATGSTARAACRVAAIEGAARVVLAVPVAPPDWTTRMAGVADELIALSTPPGFAAIGQFYDDFSATRDEEVVSCLDQARSARESSRPDGTTGSEHDVLINLDSVAVHGHLSVPDHASGLVVFAHGAGSSRHSPRNRFVARVLNDAGLATLLFDLLTEEEELDRRNVFDIALLGDRLGAVTRWCAGREQLSSLPVGYLGASTGAAAALWAAADHPEVGAIVSRGGRPDLAAPRLAEVTTPTLLVVGGHDTEVLRLNEEARRAMNCPVELRIIPGATHLFEEPGTLQQAAVAASAWFADHLSRQPEPSRN